MKESTESHINFHNVSRETESRPVQSHVKVTISIEVIGTKENVQVANCVNNDEEKEPHG